jgi:uncharacterized phage protein gp47/JayE
VIPKAATKTILRADFTPASLDLMGARFNLNSLAYVIIEKIADGKYNLECEMPGSAGNQNTGNLIPIDYIPGLQTATIPEIIVRGEDEEDTEDFRKRYLNSFDVQAFGGNQQDYIERTNLLTGGATKVSPAWAGGGTVKLTLLDSSFLPSSSQLVNNVQAAIDPLQDGQGVGIAPIGHIVTVVPADSVSVQIQAKLFFDTDYAYENVQEQVLEVIEEYLLEIRKEWQNQPEHVVRITQLESRLLSVAGIVDILNTKINGQLENLIVPSFGVPVMGGFTLET